MSRSRIVALSAGLAVLGAAPAFAQAPATIWPEPPRQSPATTVWPDPPTSPQAAPAPQSPAPRAAPAAPSGAPARANRRTQPPAAASAPPAAAPAGPAATPPKPRPPRQATAAAPAARGQAIACSGPFSRTATHLQLAQAFGAQNVVFTEVPGPEGSKLNASVVFPNDPKRRLEVLWHDEAARARPSAIVISGASRWTAPGGVRLGTPLTEVEKRNGKPFKLSGFGPDNGANVTDWDSGKLDQLGGCRMGMRFASDTSASAEALAKVTGETALTSNGPDIRAVKPKITEIIVGYGE